LEVLEGQIKDINQDVETSVAGVCKGFHGMAVRAQSAVSAASESISSGAKEGSGGKDMIAEMQKVLNSLLANVRSSSDFTQSVSAKLTSIESRLEAIEKTLGDVEELANKAKVVALNGQIEASRIGTAGLAFAVVAQETKSLSTNAASTSDAIRKLIAKLTDEVKVTADEIRQRTEIDSNSFVESEQQARELLNDIDANHKQIVNSLNKTSEISGELRGDIARAVMSMQFQDRVSQRMAHVAETLEILVHEVDAKSYTYCKAEAQGRSDQWLGQISKKYTMDSERIAISGEGQLATTASSSSDDFDVELF
jgi:methyl-accepting chemotaxis protein